METATTTVPKTWTKTKKGKPIYNNPVFMLLFLVYGYELKPRYPSGDPDRIQCSFTIDHVPFWRRKPHNLDPLPNFPDAEAPMPMVDDSLLPKLIAAIRRRHFKFGYKIARISIGARPAGSEKEPTLCTIWRA